MTNQTIIRQGDLAFVRVGDAQTDGESRPLILAHGEQSGHWHETHGGTVCDIVQGDIRYLDVIETTQIVIRPESHAGRHAPITLIPGRYRIPGQPDATSLWLGQREYRPEGVVGAAD